MLNYRVVDCRAETVRPIISLEARSPEEAAREALGEDLVRDGHIRNLRARVYSLDQGRPLALIRLYAKA